MPPRMIYVLFATGVIKARCLYVTVLVHADPDLSPGRWYHEAKDAVSDLFVRNRSAVRVDVFKAFAAFFAGKADTKILYIDQLCLRSSSLQIVHILAPKYLAVSRQPDLLSSLRFH